MENQQNLNNHINLSLLTTNSVNKIIYHNDLINSLTVLDQNDKIQITFIENEIEPLRTYLNNLHAAKIQNKIKDNENNITQYQHWINDYKQQLIELDTEMSTLSKQLDEAFVNKNISLVNQLHESLSNLQNDKQELNNKIITYENNIITCQKENEELNK